MMHTILIALGVWWLINVLRSLGKRDPAKSRLVARSPELHADIVAWHKHQHDTFAARHTVNWNKPEPKEVAPFSRLMAYWPSDVPLPDDLKLNTRS